jgi:hypothetical protein
MGNRVRFRTFVRYWRTIGENMGTIFGNCMLRRITGQERYEMRGGRRKLHNGEPHNSQSTPYNI